MCNVTSVFSVCVLVFITFLGPFLIYTPTLSKTVVHMVKLHFWVGFRFSTKVCIEFRLGLGSGMYFWGSGKGSGLGYRKNRK